MAQFAWRQMRLLAGVIGLVVKKRLGAVRYYNGEESAQRQEATARQTVHKSQNVYLCTISL